MTKDDSRPKKWTILIYFAGDNNLAEECVYALKEMKETGTQDQRSVRSNIPPKVNVIAQLDPVGRGNPTLRFKIKAAGGDGTLKYDVTKELPESDTGYWRNLLRFLCESLEDANNRADYYMVILSGHASGAREGFFLQDEERPLSSIPSSFPIWKLKNVFGNADLKKALRGKKIDILGFDACMMSTTEVCYELRNADLQYIVGSEGFTLNSGWPIQRIVAKLREDPATPPETLADFIVKDYTKFYSDYFLGGLSADMSLINLRRIGDLRRAIDRLAEALISEFENERSAINDEYYVEGGKPFQDAILLAHWAAQSYNGEQCVDLYDFCDLLQKRWHEDQSEDSVWQCCERVKSVIAEGDNRLVQKSGFTGAAFQYSYGVSLYFPWAKFDNAPGYKLLAFADGDSAWPKFLKKYLDVTQRRPRVDEIELRDTPPMNRGPGGKIYTMRNPPTGRPRSTVPASESNGKTRAGRRRRTQPR